MKNYPYGLPNCLRHFQTIAVILSAFALVALPARATDGTWNTNTGNWSTPGNWLGGVNIADGIGATANFSAFNLTGNSIVTVDTTSRTLGTLTIGDLTSTQTYLVDATGGATLIFDNNTNGALISKTSGGNDNFTVPIVLADNLTIRKTVDVRTLSISGGITGTGNLILENNSVSGSIGLSDNATFINNSGTIINQGTQAGPVTVAAKIGANVQSITQNSSTSALTLSSATGGFAGNVFVQSGTLTVNAQTGLTSNNTLSVSSGGTFQVGSNNIMTIAGLNGNGGTVQGNSATLVRSVNFGGSGTYSYGGAITDNGTGVFSITKSVGGTQTLSGANTYTGTTTVSAGTLLLNGTSSGTGAISVANSATFGRTGTTAISLGGDVTFADGAMITLSLGAAGIHSSLDRTGGIWTFDSDQAFTFVDLGGATGSYSGLITGLGFDPGTTGGWTITNSGWSGTFTYNPASGGSVDLNLSAIPEPGTWALLAFSLTTVLVLRRRRIS